MIEMGIYRTQAGYFREAYRTGDHGWPVTGATPEVRDYLRSIRPLASGRRAIDIGCGEGRHAILLAKEGFRVDAFDIEPLALKRARSFAREAGVTKGIAFRVADVLRVRGDGRYDVAVDYGCFHHLVKGDWNRYLRAVDGLLRGEGHLILSVFTPEFKHKDGARPRDGKWLVHRGHYDRFFTEREIRGVFGGRFDIKETRRDADGFCHVLMRKR